MKLAVPDLISNSYFPAAAAVELGFFKEEGLDVSLELVFPVDRAYREMRDGHIDLSAAQRIRRSPPFPNGREPNCSAHRLRACIGFSLCAPILTLDVAMSP